MKRGDFMKKIILNEIEIQLERKMIKNIHLRIKPPYGEVYVSVPKHLSDKRIQEVLELKMAWIIKNKEKFSKQAPKPEKSYLSGELFSLWGKEYPLRVIPFSGERSITLADDEIQLRIHAGSTLEQRKSLMKEWYRKQLQEAIPAIAEKYEEKMNVHAREWRIKDMKTRWGTCNIRVKRIWLNLRLAPKHPKCLEYVIVHELCHLLEKSHNAVFKNYMDIYFPDWKLVKKELNTSN